LLCRCRAPLAARILCRRRKHRPHDRAADVDRRGCRDGVVRHDNARRA
jgi:hypothetical protein